MANSKMVSLFWYWITERHSIYAKKKGGEPWPWTKDEILQTYKFTNVFRQLDAVTEELTLRKKALRAAGKNLTEHQKMQLFFHIIVFRMFNWPQTYDVLNEAGLLDKWHQSRAAKLLKKFKADGNKVFTGAYVITNSGRKEDKVDVICEAVTSLHVNESYIVTNLGNTLEGAVKLLTAYPCVGKFIAYEIVTDLRHTPLLNKAKDIMTWANPGPGAKRGLNRIHGRPLTFTQPDKLFITEMKELLDESPSKVDVGPLEMRDIEHSLCEFDKYCRVKFDGGRPRSKYSRPI